MHWIWSRFIWAIKVVGCVVWRCVEVWGGWRQERVFGGRNGGRSFFSPLITTLLLIRFVQGDPIVSSTQKVGSNVGGGPSLANNDYFGHAVALLGDVDGDGLSFDIVVGAPQDSLEGAVRGAAYVLTLDAQGKVHRSTRIGSGTITLVDQDQFGSAVACIGDVDGDGLNSDVVIGAWGDGTGGKNRGAVYTMGIGVDGAPHRIVKIASSLNGGPSLSNDDWFGSSVACIGDIDGDGMASDIAVGAYFDSTTNQGAVYVISLSIDGSAHRSVKIASSVGNTPPLSADSRFGASVSWMGEQSLVVGAIGDATGGPGRGAVYIVSLSADGNVEESDKIAHNVGGGPELNNGVQFGSSVAWLGDVDGDGIGDILVGAWLDDQGGGDRGAVYFLTLHNNQTVKSWKKIAHHLRGGPSLLNGDQFGSACAWIGDVDGDGMAGDIVVGASRDDTGGSNRGAIYILSLADLTDANTPPHVEGAALPNSTLNSLSTHLVPPHPTPKHLLPRLDPHATDPTRSILPLSILTSTPDAFNNLRVLNASIGVLACDDVVLIDGWPVPSSNSRRVGVGCIGVPEGASGEMVDVEVWFEVVLSGEMERVVGNGVAVYDDLSVPMVLETSKIASEVNGGPSLVNGDQFGSSVALLGDVDGDGISIDVAVGSKVDDDGGPDRGAVYILSLSYDGTAHRAVKIASDTGGGPTLENYDKFGSSLACVGDVDGDGLSFDIAVGSLKDGTDATDRGAVHILSLSRDGTAHRWIMIAHETNGGPSLSDNDLFGSSLACIGDVDGDGISSDLAVGAWGSDAGGNNRGAVYVLMLLSDGTAHSTIQIASSMNGGPVLGNSDAFGVSVTCVGDVDGDGVGSDVVVGAEGDDSGGGIDRGAVYVLSLERDGSAHRSVQIASSIGGGPSLDDSDLFGSSLAWIGDVDGDGISSDVLVGAYRDDYGGSDRGAVYLLMMLSTGTAHSFIKLANDLYGTPILESFDWFGIACAWLGDVDGDGMAGDIVVGASLDNTGGSDRGAIYILSLADLTDANTPPHVEGAALPNSTLNSLSTHLIPSHPTPKHLLPRLDPHATDPTRSILPLSILTSTPDAFNNLRVLNASIGVLACDDVVLIDGWPVPSSNSRRVGVGCIGVPEGASGEMVDVEVWFEVVLSGEMERVVGNGVAVYDDLSVPMVLETSKIASEVNGGPSLVNGDQFGSSVALLGDVDGDGISIDVAIGAYSNNIGGDDSGTLYILSLLHDGSVHSVVVIGSSSNGGPVLTSGDWFGYSLACIGDVDGDGLSFDIAVGTPRSDVGGANRGAVYILSLSLDRTAQRIVLIGDDTNGGPMLVDDDNFGISLACIGDVDGDGISSDLAVGAHKDDDPNESNTGAVYILSLSADGSTHRVVKIGSNVGGGPSLMTNDLFAISIAWIGDVDGDGISSDLVVGSHGYDGATGNNQGAIYVLSLTTSGTAHSDTVISSGVNGGPRLNDEDGFGKSVSWIGDVDGDGISSDVAVGTQGDDGVGGSDRGAVYLLFFSNTGIAHSFIKLASSVNGAPTLLNGDQFGSACAWIGDVDGDGMAGDIVVGASRDDTGGSDRGAIYILSLADLTDANTPPHVEGAALPNSTLNSLSTHLIPSHPTPKHLLPRLDPHATDPTRSILPLSILTSTPDAFNNLRVLNASIGVLACDDVVLIDGWPVPSSNSRRVGVGCIGVPEGASGEMVDVEVCFLENDESEVCIKSRNPLATMDGGMIYATTKVEEINLGGKSLALLGDVDGDGWGGDFAVGVVLPDGSGVVHVLEVVGDNRRVKKDTTIASGTNGMPILSPDTIGFGISMAAIGDLNFDGLSSDLAIGAPFYNARGAVFVVCVERPTRVLQLTILSHEENGGPSLVNGEEFGSSLAAVGDVDGDGIGADLIVGSRMRGVVYVIRLNTDGTCKNPIRIQGTSSASDRFGSSLVFVGDMDGNGVGDVVVGVPGYDAGGRDRGGVISVQLRAPGELKSSTLVAADGTNGGPKLRDDSLFGLNVFSLGEDAKDLFVAQRLAVPSLDQNTSSSLYTMLLHPDGSVSHVIALRDVSGVAWRCLIAYQTLPGRFEVVVGSEESVDFRQLTTYDGGLRRVDKLDVVLRRNSSSFGVCSAQPCFAQYRRGGLLGDSVVVELHLTLSPRASTAAVIRPVEVRIGGHSCSAVTFVAILAPHVAVYRCEALVLPPNVFPIPPNGKSASFVHLQGASFTYQVMDDSLWEWNAGNTLSPIPLGSKRIVETNASRLMVFVPISETTKPNGTFSIPNSSSVAPLAEVRIDGEFTNMPIARESRPGIVVDGGVGFVAESDSEESSSGVWELVHASAILRFCSAGLDIGRSRLTTFSGVLQVELPPVTLLLPQITHVAAPPELAIGGGSEVFIHGSHFGAANLSASSDPLSNASVFCGSVWDKHGFKRGRVSSSDDPTKVVLGAYVGGRSCLTTEWLNESTIRCIAPHGLGSNVAVSVSIEGKVATLDHAVSYSNPAAVTDCTPSTQLPLSGSASTTLTLSTPSVPLPSQIPGVTQYGSRIGEWEAVSSSISLTPPAIASSVPIPAGAGGNHPVSLCFKDDPSAVVTAAARLSTPPRISCTSSSNAATVNYTTPTIIGVEPSVDLDPLGGNRLVLSGANFGTPSVVAEGNVIIAVLVAGNPCVSLSHPSSTEVRCTTLSMPGVSVASVAVIVGGLGSNTVEVAVLRVSLLAVVPRFVLPAAEGRLSYDFSVSVFAAEQVTAVIIGGQRCDTPTLESEELLICRGIPAPSEWPTDDSWLEIIGSNASVSRRPVLRAAPPPSILAVDTTAGGAPTSGGSTATVVGAGFGLEETDFAGVMIGSGEEGVYASESSYVFLRNTSSNVTWISSSAIRVVLPPGLGSAVPVRVESTWGLISPSSLIAYDTPIPTSITPNVLLPGLEGLVVVVCGSSFPPARAWVDELVIGGVECDEHALDVISDNCVRCNALHTPGAPSSTTQENGWDVEEAVVVTVGGRTSAFARGLATFVPLPFLSDATITTVSPGSRVGLEGVGMGADEGYVEAVYVGGGIEDVEMVRNGTKAVSTVASASDVVRILSSLEWLSGVRIRFTMPNGVGRNVAVRFATSTNLLSNSVFLSYSPPLVSSVAPSTLLPGWKTLNVTLLGSNFPTRQKDLTLVSIGGVECDNIELIDSTSLMCVNIATPTSPWASEVVIVEAGGQASPLSNAGATFVEPPVVTSLVPTTAGEGDEVQLVGRGFGVELSNIADVTIGGVSCKGTLIFETPTSLRCNIPSPHPIWLAGADQVLVIPQVNVVVRLVSGIASNPNATDANSYIVPAGLRHRPNPHLQPTGIVAWRPVAQSGTVFVRWRFPGASLESYLNSIAGGVAAAAPVSTFSVELSLHSNFSSGVENTQLSRGRSAPEKIAQVGIIDQSHPDAWEWFDARVPVFETSPLFVRVRAENVDGEGEWVVMEFAAVKEVGSRVSETCADSQYLTTHMPLVDEMVCKSCPIGATCAGLTSCNVTAEQGYWRVPWSPFSLGFARCFIQDACIGTVTDPALLPSFDPAIIITSNNTAREVWDASDQNSYPAAIRGVQLDPSIERCREGHRGVLCGACEPSYFPGVGRICTTCGNKGWIAGRFLLLVFAILVIFSLLLLRAWKKRAERSSKEVIIAKLFFSHLQSIAIVGAVQLRWPKGAEGFFATVDAGSSFTTSGLALECLLGAASSSPFARTAAILAMPIFLVLFSLVFWICIQRCEDQSDWCTRFLRSEDENYERDKGMKKVRRGSIAATLSTSMHTTLRRRMLVSTIVIAFLVHTPLTSAAFRLLTCQSIAPEDDPEAAQLRLAMDLDVNCEDPKSLSAMLGMGLPMLIFISFGIPVGAALFLRSIGPETLHTTTWRELLGFLFNGYRKKLYYWESIVLMRKVMLAFVTTVLAPSGPTMQLLTAIIVILLAQIVHSRSRPYQSNVINALESFGMVAAAMTLIGGVFVIADGSGLTGTSSSFVTILSSVLIVTVNTLFFLAVLILISKRGRLAAAAWLDQVHVLPDESDLPSRRGMYRFLSSKQVSSTTTSPRFTDDTIASETSIPPSPVRASHKPLLTTGPTLSTPQSTSRFAFENPLQALRPTQKK